MSRETSDINCVASLYSIHLCLINKRILCHDEISARLWCWKEPTRHKRLLPPEGKVAIVPSQQKVLAVLGEGAPAHQLCRLASCRVPGPTTCCLPNALVFPTNLDVFWINGVQILYPVKRNGMKTFLFYKSRISVIVACWQSEI